MHRTAVAEKSDKRDMFMRNADEQLVDHLLAEHHAQINPVASTLQQTSNESEKVCFSSAYQEAIAIAIRRGAPLASYSIDRRSLFNASQGLRSDTVEALICFWCSRRFPYRRTASANEISWHNPAMTTRCSDDSQAVEYDFLGIPRVHVADIFGMDSYLDKYGQCDPEGPDLRQCPEEFRDFHLKIPFTNGTVKVLCCPEDRDCRDESCRKGDSCCPQCKIPVCMECDRSKINREGRFQMPPAALANDLMIFYAPRELYTQNVTILEMICASPCLTSMICFSLEKKYRGQRAFDDKVHMNRHRVGARGNATSFPLPWQNLLQQLQGDEPDLPHTGVALSSFVSVLLKTSDEDDTKESLAKFIHQALVRRDVVVTLIANAVERGHLAYRHLDLHRVRQKAQELPEHGVPAHILKLLPYDDMLDKIQVQKAATPVPGRTEVEDAALSLAQLKPNGVVLEQSSYDEADIMLNV